MEEQVQSEPIETFKPNESKDGWAKLEGKPKGKLLNQIDEKGIIKNIDASTIRTGTLTGAKIQTSLQGARVIMGGDNDERNDILLVDDTTGGTTPITGNTASIKFARSDDATQVFRIQKRSGTNSDNENIIEMFYEKDANASSNNYIFIGKKGDGSDSDIHTDSIQLEAKDGINTHHKNTVSTVANIAVQTTTSAGGTLISLNASKANSDTGAGGGGAYISFTINNNESATGSTFMYIDKDGIHLQSATQAGVLGVNDSTGALQWNGVDIS